MVTEGYLAFLWACVNVDGEGKGERIGIEQKERKGLTFARCCCPVAKVLSFRAVGVLFPLVAYPGALMSTEASIEG